MAEFKIVARYRDGRLLKGFCRQFVPDSKSFRLVPSGAGSNAALEIQLPELKGVFFVKDFAGRADYKDAQRFEASRLEGGPRGRRVRVRFSDGEWMLGTTERYWLDRPGFFVVPADPRSNIERCFVVTEATRSVSLF